MSDLESIILSPTFTIALAVVGLVLFTILSREFLLWFLKINRLSSKIESMDEKIDELSNTIEKLKLSEGKPLGNSLSANFTTNLAILPPLPQQENKFPLTH